MQISRRGSSEKPIFPPIPVITVPRAAGGVPSSYKIDLVSLFKRKGGSRMQKDRREHKRFLYECFVRFWADGLTHPGFTTDLSLWGLSIASNVVSPVKENIDIELSLPNDTNLYLWGILAWRMVLSSKENNHSPAQRMGIRLIGTPPEYMAFIEGLTLEKQGYSPRS